MTELESSVSQDNTSRIRRRSRTCFTKVQLDELESSFSKTPYPDSSTRQRLVKALSIEEQIIQIWFKNRRAKQRRTQKMPSDDTISHSSYTFQGEQSLSNPHISCSPGTLPHVGDGCRYSASLYQPGSLNHLVSNGYLNFSQMYNAYNGQFCPASASPHPSQYVLYNPQVDPRYMAQRPCYPFQNSQSHPVLVSNDLHHSFVALEEKENADH